MKEQLLQLQIEKSTLLLELEKFPESKFLLLTLGQTELQISIARKNLLTENYNNEFENN